MSGHKAAQIARDAATGGMTPTYRLLSSKMCWDAVVHCQVRAGRVDPGSITVDNHGGVISSDDHVVADHGAMQHVPQGSFIGFFDGDRLIHAMICVGAGMAAGNKNACIGVGGPIGWEILDLSSFFAGAGRPGITVRYRTM